MRGIGVTVSQLIPGVLSDSRDPQGPLTAENTTVHTASVVPTETPASVCVCVCNLHACLCVHICLCLLGYACRFAFLILATKLSRCSAEFLEHASPIPCAVSPASS